MIDIDWDVLRTRAIEAMERAYAPYSGYPVGAAALVDDGRIIMGCNVENASTGIGTCAENGVASQLYITGGGKLVAIYCVNGNGEPVVPCGRCRQILFEHGGPNLLVNMPEGGPMPMSQVLPQAFGPANLGEVATGVVVETPYALRDSGAN